MVQSIADLSDAGVTADADVQVIDAQVIGTQDNGVRKGTPAVSSGYDLESVIHALGKFSRKLELSPFDNSFSYKIGFYNQQRNDTRLLSEKFAAQGSAYAVYEFPLQDAKPFVIVNKELVDKIFFYLMLHNGTPKIFGFNDPLPELEDYRVPVVSSEKEYLLHLLAQERKKQALNASAKDVSDLLAHARHELGTHAAIIKGYLELLSMGRISLARVQPTYALLIRNAESLLAVIDALSIDALDNQNDSQGIYQILPDDKCNADKILTQVHAQTELLKARYGKEHIQVEYDIGIERKAEKEDEKKTYEEATYEEADEKPWKGVYANIVKVSQINLQAVLYNLIGNALKYTDRGKITVKAYPDERHYIIEVSDTGIGIPADFDPFEERARADNVGKREGNGLGLAIVKHIVDGYNGRISYTSKLGEGTRFKLELPLL